jgi:hypothetical protein
MIGLIVVALLSYEDVLHTDLVAHAKIRWSKIDAGERVTVEIDAGRATRSNPNWSPKPAPLTYDLSRNRELERILKWAKLPRPRSEPSSKPRDRTLEIVVEDGKQTWRTAGYWSMSVKAWQKGRLGSIFDALEPLLDVKPELFDAQDKEERSGGLVPR